jgi:hypothetical protein
MATLDQDDNNHERVVYELADKKASSTFQKAFGLNIRISRYDYKIIYCKKLMEGGEHCSGLADMREKKIYLLIGSGDELITFLHEIAHAELCESGITARPSWCPELEEQMVELWGRSMASFLEHLSALGRK